MASTTTERTQPQLAAPRTLAGGFAALRIFMGLVWVSNALAKVFSQGTVDWGFFSFNLITATPPCGSPPTRRRSPRSHPSQRSTATWSCRTGDSSASS
jgi:hypothetical protein